MVYEIADSEVKSPPLINMKAKNKSERRLPVVTLTRNTSFVGEPSPRAKMAMPATSARDATEKMNGPIQTRLVSMSSWAVVASFWGKWDRVDLRHYETGRSLTLIGKSVARCSLV